MCEDDGRRRRDVWHHIGALTCLIAVRYPDTQAELFSESDFSYR